MQTNGVFLTINLGLFMQFEIYFWAVFGWSEPRLNCAQMGWAMVGISQCDFGLPDLAEHS